MYSVIANVGACVLLADGAPSKYIFEPGIALRNLPSQLFNTGYTAIIIIADGEDTLEYELETFLKKEYKTDGKTIRFGGKRMSIATLSVTLGFRVIFENFDQLIDTELD